MLPTHATPVSHAFPQEPQSSAFEVVSTHWPLQTVSPVEHLLVHWPLTQASPEVHALPQLPQFLASLWVLVQSVPQRVSVPVQVRVQTFA